jgi:hypothetical protein
LSTYVMYSGANRIVSIALRGCGTSIAFRGAILLG